MTIKVENSTIVGATARMMPRRSTGLVPLPLDAVASRPQRFNKDGKPVKFNNSEGYAWEEGAAWVANELGSPLSGYERHAASMIDAGLCEPGDLF